MRIGILTEHNIAKGGGVEESIVGLIKALEGNEIVLCCLDIGDLREVKRLYHSDIKIDKIYRINSPLRNFIRGGFMSRIALLFPFKRMIEHEKLDLIIDADGGLVHKFLPKDFPKKKYIIWRLCLPIEPWIKDIFKEPKLFLKALWRTIDRSLIDNFLRPSPYSRIYAVDEYTNHQIGKIWKLKCVGYLYSPIKFNELEYHGKKNQFHLINVGRFSVEKDYAFCIEVINELKKKYPKIKMTFIGACKTMTNKNYLNLLKQRVQKYNLESNIEFMPNASFEDMVKKLKEARIFFHAQKGISSQIVVTEAMAAGCIPVVRSEGGSWHEILEDGKYGFGYKTKKECITLLSQLLKKNLKKEMKMAISKAKEYSEESFKKRVHEIISEVTK